jgi:hypothetical protein
MNGRHLAYRLLQFTGLFASKWVRVPEQHRKLGMRVEITNGGLAGLEGQSLRRGNPLLLNWLRMRSFQRGASVEIESCMTQRSDEPPRPPAADPHSR